MELRRFLRIEDVTIDDFAKTLGISRTSMFQILSGHEPRLSLALKIQRLTNGQVTLEELVSKKKPSNQNDKKPNK